MHPVIIVILGSSGPIAMQDPYYHVPPPQRSAPAPERPRPPLIHDPRFATDYFDCCYGGGGYGGYSYQPRGTSFGYSDDGFRRSFSYQSYRQPWGYQPQYYQPPQPYGYGGYGYGDYGGGYGRPFGYGQPSGYGYGGGG